MFLKGWNLVKFAIFNLYSNLSVTFKLKWQLRSKSHFSTLKTLYINTKTHLPLFEVKAKKAKTFFNGVKFVQIEHIWSLLKSKCYFKANDSTPQLSLWGTLVLKLSIFIWLATTIFLPFTPFNNSDFFKDGWAQKAFAHPFFGEICTKRD